MKLEGEQLGSTQLETDLDLLSLQLSQLALVLPGDGVPDFVPLEGITVSLSVACQWLLSLGIQEFHFQGTPIPRCACVDTKAAGRHTSGLVVSDPFPAATETNPSSLSRARLTELS